jgi:hypothetical protein
MNELRDEVRRFAWSLSPADMATLSELDAESRIYWLREMFGVSLAFAFKTVKLLSSADES